MSQQRRSRGSRRRSEDDLEDTYPYPYPYDEDSVDGIADHEGRDDRRDSRERRGRLQQKASQALNRSALPEEIYGLIYAAGGYPEGFASAIPEAAQQVGQAAQNAKRDCANSREYARLSRSYPRDADRLICTQKEISDACRFACRSDRARESARYTELVIAAVLAVHFSNDGRPFDVDRLGGVDVSRWDTSANFGNRVVFRFAPTAPKQPREERILGQSERERARRFDNQFATVTFDPYTGEVNLSIDEGYGSKKSVVAQYPPSQLPTRERTEEEEDQIIEAARVTASIISDTTRERGYSLAAIPFYHTTVRFHPPSPASSAAVDGILSLIEDLHRRPVDIVFADGMTGEFDITPDAGSTSELRVEDRIPAQNSMMESSAWIVGRVVFPVV